MSRRPLDFATLLYRQLPEVFRERDNTLELPDGSRSPGDLARLCATWGDLLDALYRSQLQRYYDIFPEQEGDPDSEGLARGCQPWVLPYLAQLLDVQLIAPLATGRRKEVARAIAWRQRKGTPRAVEDIADSVAGIEVELGEGFRKVATTPRAGFSLLPESVFGEADGRFDRRFRLQRAEHPGLPGGSIDFRRASRAIRADAESPASKTTTFAGSAIAWRQSWPHGVPCFALSFQDVAVRSADLRSATGSRGHAHPRRVMLHAPPFPGFFAPQPLTVLWSDIGVAVINGTALPEDLPLTLVSTAGSRTLSGISDSPVRIEGVVDLTGPIHWSLAKLWFDDRVEVSDGRVVAVNCAFRELQVHTVDAEQPVVVANDCLCERLLAPGSLIRATYMTVLEGLVCERLQLSDSILLLPPRGNLIDDDVPAGGCIRYSRLPQLPLPPDPLDPTAANDPHWVSQGQRSLLRVHVASCSTLAPIFWHTDFAQPGCAVLHPAADERLRFGAEDGGEMGACHALAYALRERAVSEKLKDFLPVGIEAVLAPDASLLCAPPQPR
ncbi:MAG: phage tail protein [Candidatus Accumulibacter sp. UW26]|jgi:hypothetical protein